MNRQIGFIGAGQMATALAGGFLESGQVNADSIHVFDPSENAIANFQERVSGAKIHSTNEDVMQASEWIFLAVKPNVLNLVCSEILSFVRPEHTFVSIAAGVPISFLSQNLNSDKVIRTMPNTPCLIGKGAIGMATADEVSQQTTEEIKGLLESVGIVETVKEYQLDAVTGLSGSGPAYAFTILDALSDAGVMQGLPRNVATKLAAQTLLGAAAMVLETESHPGVLKDQVTSPAGTTISGLHELECGGLRSALQKAVMAATRRSKELGKN